MLRKDRIRTRVNRSSTSDLVADYLRKRIENGPLRPGKRITEPEIAEALGVSRSPVREALLQLSKEGLVTIVPYRGAIVSKLQRDRFNELFHFRLNLEEFAIARVVELASNAQIENLRTYVERIRKAAAAGDSVRCVDADLRLHEYLVSLSRNSFLRRTYGEMLSLMRLYIRLTATHYENLSTMADDHEALIQALFERDVRRARKLLRDHIEYGFQAALTKLEE